MSVRTILILQETEVIWTIYTCDVCHTDITAGLGLYQYEPCVHHAHVTCLSQDQTALGTCPLCTGHPDFWTRAPERPPGREKPRSTIE
jgi:hypothetical protein